MAWASPLDENLSSFKAMLDDDDWYGRDNSVIEDIRDPFCYPSSVAAFDGHGGILEGLLGCSSVYPTSPMNNVYGNVTDISGARVEACPEPKLFQNLASVKNERKGKGQSASGDEDEEKDYAKVGSGGEGEANHGRAPPPVNNHRGKKNGMPAKNLMAERRRRKKLNDRLYMLRSVVPKISKMDRASILGDAVEYLKELLQRINDLHNELELSPRRPILSGSLINFQPLTSTEPALHCQVKEESPVSLPNLDSHPARVEVGTREGKALNIHMFCGRRPGLLLSTMRALDGLGLDVKQAVISCFNGFALDVFQAEQSMEGDIAPEEIKAVLLHTAGCEATM